MSTRYRDWFIIVSLVIASTLAVWLPFALHLRSFLGVPLQNTGLATLISNYDGPYYLVIAKSLYDKEIIRGLFSFPTALEYYPAHFPLFPLLIRLVSPILGSGFGMLVVTLVGSALAAIATYELLRGEWPRNLALPAALVFLLFPARWVVVRSIGAPEPWFIFFLVSSLIFFRQNRYWQAGVFGALATLTKSPGILLFAAYFLYLLTKLIKSGSWTKSPHWKAYPIFLIPLSLVGLFWFYGIQTGDFLAYFHSGDNIHLQFLPFQIFNSQQPWVGTFWLEDVIYLYLLGGLALVELIRQKKEVLAWFFGIFFTTLLFVSHRDLARYSLPIAPIALTAFAPLLARKEIRLVLIILTIPIYLFVLNFIANNILPIPDWSALR